jgi:hypothetical protein
VLAALRLEADRLPVPRADGDREALRILLVARQEITTVATAQASRLRALLLAGDDTDRRAARTTLSKTALAPWPGGNYPLMPAANMPSARPRSPAWRSRSAKPGASSKTTARSCWPSLTTSLPASPAATGSARSAPPRPS